jgi:outer membrane protein insertion porin family
MCSWAVDMSPPSPVVSTGTSHVDTTLPSLGALDLSADTETSKTSNQSLPTPAAIDISTPSLPAEAAGAPALGGLNLSTSTTSGSYEVIHSTSLPGIVPAPEAKHPAHTARILRIQVEGNKNVRERVILAQVKTKKNDYYDPEALRKDVQSIYGLGNFDDVTVDLTDVPGGMFVTFRVVEKPMIKRIDFKGNKKLSASKLRDAIALKENDPLDKLKLNSDVDKIINLYKDEGFAAAQVEPFTTSDPTNHVTITFYITEGTQVLVEDVTLDGVNAFPVKKIRKLMKTKHKKVFKQETLTKDLEEITKYYKNHGYQNIKIGDAVQTFNADKTRITIRIPIEEGPLFHFGTVHYTGNAIFPSEKLSPAMQFKAGEIFNQEKLDASIAKLQDIYGAQGYIRVQIKPNFDQDAVKGIVNIDFHIDEGEVVYVDHIGVEGNTHTKEYVIRREILLKEGEPFSSVKARKSVERLYNLGFLDNVDVDVQQPNSPNKADVIYTVTEGKPGVLSAGAGFSSVDGLIGTLQVQHTNFLGRGQRVNLQWQFGGRVNSFDLGWTEPWFLGKPLTFGVDLFRTTRIQQLGTDLNAYDSHNTGASLTAGPRFSEIYSLLFTYTYANTVRDTVDPNLDPNTRSLILGPNAATDPTITSFHAIKSNLTEQIIRDGRDNQFDPTRGTRSSLAITEGGLAFNSIKYNKGIVDESVHIPTFWKFVLSIHGQWGLIKPYGSSTLTDIVDELFRVGGSDTVRGYQLGQVGVLNGGQVENVYNVEYKFPIAPDEHGRTLLQGVLFYDIGGSWNNISGISYQVNNTGLGLMQGVGFGIRFKTPVFPLRLDWGYALNPPAGQSPSQFYFTVGSIF